MVEFIFNLYLQSFVFKPAYLYCNYIVQRQINNIILRAISLSPVCIKRRDKNRWIVWSNCGINKGKLWHYGKTKRSNS